MVSPFDGLKVGEITNELCQRGLLNELKGILFESIFFNCKLYSSNTQDHSLQSFDFSKSPQS